MNGVLSRHSLCSSAIIFGLLSIALTSHAAPFFEFTGTGEAGDFIGGGQSYFRNQDFGTVSVNAFDLTGDGQTDYLDTFILGNIQGQFMIVTIGTNQLGQNLHPGVYDNAERAGLASAGHPGLDIAIDSRGCGTVTGRFVLNDIAFVAGNVLDRLDVAFEQHCEGAIPAFVGRFRYDRTNPLSPLVAEVPTVGSLSLLLLMALIAALAVADFRQRAFGLSSRSSSQVRPRNPDREIRYV